MTQETDLAARHQTLKSSLRDIEYHYQQVRLAQYRVEFPGDFQIAEEVLKSEEKQPGALMIWKPSELLENFWDRRQDSLGRVFFENYVVNETNRDIICDIIDELRNEKTGTMVCSSNNA